MLCELAEGHLDTGCVVCMPCDRQEGRSGACSASSASSTRAGGHYRELHDRHARFDLLARKGGNASLQRGSDCLDRNRRQ